MVVVKKKQNVKKFQFKKRKKFIKK
jgi:hypothetical protein